MIGASGHQLPILCEASPPGWALRVGATETEATHQNCSITMPCDFAFKTCLEALVGALYRLVLQNRTNAQGRETFETVVGLGSEFEFSKVSLIRYLRRAMLISIIVIHVVESITHYVQ